MVILFVIVGGRLEKSAAAITNTENAGHRWTRSALATSEQRLLFAVVLTSASEKNTGLAIVLWGQENKKITHQHVHNVYLVNCI